MSLSSNCLISIVIYKSFLISCSVSFQSVIFPLSSLGLLLLNFFFPIFSTDLPSAPGNPVATRNTDTSVVVSWAASKDVAHLVGYYIDCSVVGSNVWMPCNNKPVKKTR